MEPPADQSRHALPIQRDSSRVPRAEPLYTDQTLDSRGHLPDPRGPDVPATRAATARRDVPCCGPPVWRAASRTPLPTPDSVRCPSVLLHSISPQALTAQAKPDYLHRMCYGSTEINVARPGVCRRRCIG